MVTQKIPAAGGECGKYIILGKDKSSRGAVFLTGYGERGNGTTDLRKFDIAGYIGVNNDPNSIASATDYFDFDLVLPQTPDNYAHGEARQAYNYLINVLGKNPSEIDLICHSNGVYGALHWIAVNDPGLFKLFANIIFSAAGPGTRAESAKAVVDSGRPTWLLTSEADVSMWESGDDVWNHTGKLLSGSGTSHVVTDQLYDQMIALGYKNVWKTKYNKATHNGIFTSTFSAFGLAPGKPNNWHIPAYQGVATGTFPKMTVYQWMLANRLGSPIVAPTDILSPTGPVTPPPPPPPPAPKVIAYLLDNNTWSADAPA